MQDVPRLRAYSPIRKGVAFGFRQFILSAAVTDDAVGGFITEARTALARDRSLNRWFGWIRGIKRLKRNMQFVCCCRDHRSVDPDIWARYLDWRACP